MGSKMSDLICQALSNKQRIAFVYNGKARIGEPQCCGVSTAGKETVRVYLLRGGTRSEQLFELAKVEQLNVLPDTFAKPGPNYRKNNSAMKDIYCQL